MRLFRTAMPVLALVQFCWASTVASPDEARALEEASKAAERGQLRAEALETLESVAEGKPLGVIRDAAKRAGVLDYFLRSRFLQEDYTVRAYALEMIGRTGLPEALEYLSAVTPEMLGPDQLHLLYPASKVALQKARLRAEPDQTRQVELLERQLTAPIVPTAVLWSAQELCDRGSTRSMDLVAHKFRMIYSGPRGEEYVEFCRTRMDIVNSDPDRARALGSVLRVDAKVDKEKILRWAVYQLLELNTAEANAILDRYAAEVRQRFPDVPGAPESRESSMHGVLAQEIRYRSRR